jgi:hypothetical protein|tara:strand:+ start:331 stop:537 length:207 start_codon:yes stop_codon:yes gene_type:complete
MSNRLSLEDSYTQSAFLVEKELGVKITPDYPAFKFVTQLEEMEKYYKRQNEEYERAKSRGSGSSFRSS